MLTHSLLYLLRKPVFAAVINNLEVSPAMHSFKSSQLAAWLSPLHSQSVIRATCRPPIIVPPSDHTSLLVFLMPQLLLQKNPLLLQLEQLVFLSMSWTEAFRIFCVTSCSNTRNSSVSRQLSFLVSLILFFPPNFLINSYLQHSYTFEAAL